MRTVGRMVCRKVGMEEGRKVYGRCGRRDVFTEGKVFYLPFFCFVSTKFKHVPGAINALLSI